MVSNPATVSYRLFVSGYCTAYNRIIDPKNGRGKARFYAVWLLIEHPQHGIYMFDTGYSPRFLETTRHFPDKFYAWATPVFIKKDETAMAQLAQAGIKPSDLSGMIISHFHADHVAGMLDFPKIPIVCHSAAIEQVLSVKGFGAVRHGLLKALIPDDLRKRARIIKDIMPNPEEPPSLQFQDLFGDGSVELVQLPGHARGQLGIRIHTFDHTLFFATDAAWRKSTLDAGVLPSPTVKLFFDDWAAYKTTFFTLRNYQQTFPTHRLLFTHCPETLAYISSFNS